MASMCPLSSLGAEFIANNPTSNPQWYAGIFNPGQAFSDDIFIHSAEIPANATAIIGYLGNANNSAVINGGLTAEIASTGVVVARGIRLDAGASLTVAGNTTLTVSTGEAMAVGIGVYPTASRLDLSAGLTNLSVSSGSGRIMGIDVEGQSVLEIGDAVVNLNASAASSSLRWIQGLYGANGTAHSTGSVTFNLTSYNDEGELVDAGDPTVARVVNLEGSAYNTNAVIDGNLTINAHMQTGEIFGVYVSGDTQSSEDLHAGLAVGGTITVNVEGSNRSVHALYAQGESGISAERAVVSVRSEMNSQLDGLVATINPASYPGPGRITLENGLQETMTGYGKMTGVLSSGAYDGRGSQVDIGGSVQIQLESQDDAATAIRVDDQAHASVKNAVLSVKAQGAAIGADLESGTLTLKGANEVLVQGGTDALGINAVNGSSLSLVGTMQVTAATALKQDSTSAVTVGATGEPRSSLVLNGGVQNEGTISLDSASLTIAGDANGDFRLGSISADAMSEVNLGEGAYQIDLFAGDNEKTLRLNSLEAQVKLTNVEGSATIAASGSANDSSSSAAAAAQSLLGAVTFEDAADRSGQQLVVEEGLVNDALYATIDENGELANVRTQANTKLSTMGDVASLSLLSWRHDTNSLFERMGELRDMPLGVGGWARVYGSELAYGAQSVQQKSTTIELGADRAINQGWMVGGAFSYTDSSSDYRLGQADGSTYAVATYATWLGENGQFVDLAAKYGRLSTDFDVDVLHGSLDNDALSLSVEFGHRFALADIAFAEPQIEMTYSRVFGDDFSAGSNVEVSQDDFESIIGRVGLRSGFFFPEKKGALYAHFSVLNDFAGDLRTEVNNGIARNRVEDDLGGAWVEYGVGGSYRFGDRTNGYVNLERSSGGEVDMHWRWNIGMRHVF